MAPICANYMHAGHDVISLDIMHTDNHPWECITADIRDSIQLEGIDWIVHLAAQISVPRSVDNPDETLSINVDGTASIVSSRISRCKTHSFCIKRCSLRRLRNNSYSRRCASNPSIPLRCIKNSGRGTNEKNQISTCSLRFFNVYGPGQSSEGGYAAVIPAFKKAIELGNECKIFGDGTQVRDFIHVDDLVRIISLSLESKNLPSE